MARARTVALVVAALAGVAVTRHLRGAMTGRRGSGGILVGDAAAYDRLAHGVLLRSFLDAVAADVAAAAPPGARVLEVGCGPGRLSIRLAGRHRLDVTGLDLDPAMVDRARANAGSAAGDRMPRFVVGDVASLPYPDGSFDVAVSTLSMHHWTDPAVGLAEIGRVLRPDGRALVWDLRPGIVPLHRDVPDPVATARGSRLRVVTAGPWRWPGRLALTRRIELARADDATEESA
jgi:SAM-dependent methyltransferase